MKEMRRKEKAISSDESTALLAEAEYGVLSSVSADGKPYGVPLNYCVINNCIYFHCAVEGHKIDNFKQNSSVSFCVVGKTEPIPEDFSTKYESVIATGVIEEAFDDDKEAGLVGLIEKYSPEYRTKGLKYIADAGAKTKVFKISIDRLTGKAGKK